MRTRPFVLEVGVQIGMLIHGKTMAMDRVDEVVTLGDTEIWEITNFSGIAHPFHIHDGPFLILRRDGVPPSPCEAGWKDVVVNPDEVMRVIKQFVDYADSETPYMYHCHLLEHEDAGMMGQFTVLEHVQPTID